MYEVMKIKCRHGKKETIIQTDCTLCFDMLLRQFKRDSQKHTYKFIYNMLLKNKDNVDLVLATIRRKIK